MPAGWRVQNIANKILHFVQDDNGEVLRPHWHQPKDIPYGVILSGAKNLFCGTSTTCHPREFPNGIVRQE